MEKTILSDSCICVHCDTRIPHVKGEPCKQNKCPQCGKKMLRQGGYHHQLYVLKKNEHESSSTNKG